MNSGVCSSVKYPVNNPSMFGFGCNAQITINNMAALQRRHKMSNMNTNQTDRILVGFNVFPGVQPCCFASESEC